MKRPRPATRRASSLSGSAAPTHRAGGGSWLTRALPRGAGRGDAPAATDGATMLT